MRPQDAVISKASLVQRVSRLKRDSAELAAMYADAPMEGYKVTRVLHSLTCTEKPAEDTRQERLNLPCTCPA